MNTDIYSQLYSLAIFFIVGVFIGILFDLFRIIRRTFKTNDIITYIEDIIFWILVGLILLFSIFFFNKGELRSYVFIGLAIGFITYILTISKYFIRTSVNILTYIKEVLYKIFKVIYIIVDKSILEIFRVIIKNMSKFAKKRNKDLSKNIIVEKTIDKYDKIEE